ncbi:unnamed protein product, partial [Cyprideis torosa]
VHSATRKTGFRQVGVCFIFCVEFDHGCGQHALACTESGELYAWGHNGYCQLGNGSTNAMVTIPAQVHFPEKKVIEVACGSHHSLALTAEGEVFAWGQNNFGQVGSGTTTNQPLPRRVGGALTERAGRVKAICAGQTSSFAVTEAGEVFSWGNNGNGQLGLGSSGNQPMPSRVPALSGVYVIQVTCGYAHTLALCDDGAVYAWGANSYGQLGTGNKNNSSVPVKVCTKEVFAWGQNNFGQVGSGTTTNQPLPRRVGGALTERAGRVKAICAGQTSSFAVTEAGEVTCGYAHTRALCDDGAVYAWGANSYGQLGTGNKNNSSVPVKVCTKETQNMNVWMWGQCRGQSVLEPYQTELKSMHTVFASFGSPAVTFRPMAVEVDGGPTITESMALAFNDEETSDVKFLVDNSMIYAHRCFLRFRCQHFRAMFSDQWVEAEKDVIPVEQFSYAVYYAFIKYLYTDTLDLNVEDAIGVSEAVEDAIGLSRKRSSGLRSGERMPRRCSWYHR